jgi:hypothetical protein
MLMNKIQQMFAQQTIKYKCIHYNMLLKMSRDITTKSEFCSNKSSSAINSRVVERIVRIFSDYGGEIAIAEEAREILRIHSDCLLCK